MNKGIATETIAKMLLAIIVVAIVVYMIYKYVWDSPLDYQKCAAMMSAWCGSCEIAKPSNSNVFSGGSGMNTKLQECINRNILNVNLYLTNCNGAEDDCKGFLLSTSS